MSMLRSCLRACALLAGLWAPPALASSCPAYLTNPVTDVCWRCILPLSLGSVEMGNIGGQRDLPNPSSPVCFCPGTPPKVGLSMGFWEPIYINEIVRTPYCFPALGGLKLPESIPAPRHARRARSDTGVAPDAFYQVHHYKYPLLFLLGVLADHPCLEHEDWDIGYLTEVDPTWGNSSLSAIFNPEALLFANPIAAAACAADCVAATAGFPRRELYWCAGCQGSMFPNNGWTTHHTGLVDTSLLMNQRLMFKLHRQLMAWRYHGTDARCGPQWQPLMDKRAYKPQMLAPRAVTGSTPGGCCPPMGANSITWRAAREFPISGEDAVYLLFRKRNCCLSPY